VAARGPRPPHDGGTAQRYMETESAYPGSTYAEPTYRQHVAEQYRPSEETRPLNYPMQDPRQ
jgi:hypothetical protein